MGKIGTTELVLILVVALLIFGPSKLPALGKQVGDAFGKLRRYTNSENWGEFLDDDDEEEEAPKKAKVSAKKEAPAEEEAPAAEEPVAEVVQTEEPKDEEEPAAQA